MTCEKWYASPLQGQGAQLDEDWLICAGYCDSCWRLSAIQQVFDRQQGLEEPS